MERREFIQLCSGACLALAGISLMEGCVTTNQIPGKLMDNKIQFPKMEFVKVSEEKKSFRKYVIVKPEKSDYPIIVYRKQEGMYEALLLQCSHQGNELSVNGDILTCSAHGSEFNNQGQVITGPAETGLKSFKVTYDDYTVYIHLI